MHATLLTVLLVTAAQQPSFGAQGHLTMVTEDCGCTTCSPRDYQAGCGGWTLVWRCLAACCGPMPQTCSPPPFGCCPGNNRSIPRCPAFHGYYCRPYNYRQLFDYPWHSTPYEPRGFFACPDPGPSREEVPTPYPEPEGLPFELLPSAADSP
jgi:hypothetical protein